MLVESKGVKYMKISETFHPKRDPQWNVEGAWDWELEDLGPHPGSFSDPLGDRGPGWASVSSSV